MSDMVVIVDGKVSSRHVAEKFGKEHKNVLRDIESILSTADSAFSRLNFEPRDYVDGRGKTQPEIGMTRDGFSLLAMGFTGPEALKWKVKFIEAFNQMERALTTPAFKIPTTMSEALRLAAEAYEEKECALAEAASAKFALEAATPKVEAYDRFMDSDGLISMGDAAKALGVGRTTAFRVLREQKIFQKVSNTPYQQYVDAGYFKVKMSAAEYWSGAVAKVTSKGMEFLSKVFTSTKGTKNGTILPVQCED